MTLETILATHQYDYPDSFCGCGAYVGKSPWIDHPAHVADAIREWLTNDQAIDAAEHAVAALEMSLPRQPEPADYARAAITAALTNQEQP